METNTSDFQHPQDVARSARRLAYLSRGLPLAVVGVWMAGLSGLQLTAAVLPAIQPYAKVLSFASAVGMVLCQLWIRRAQAQSPCSVRTQRESNTREEATLFGVITLGVLGVVALAETGRFEQPWIGPAFLCLMLTLGGAYFIFEAFRVKLFELALLGTLFLGLCVLSLYLGSFSQNGAAFDQALNTTLAASGLFCALIGILLHRRWSAWRAQVLQA
ncbi:MAG TPA: hypothetical protein VEK08_13370 [Planctomycetota bacterium]|nr:hypothetical protein [Planctomycetota bacterium]